MYILQAAMGLAIMFLQGTYLLLKTLPFLIVIFFLVSVRRSKEDNVTLKAAAFMLMKSIARALLIVAIGFVLLLGLTILLSYNLGIS